MKIKMFQLRNNFERRYGTDRMDDRDHAEGMIAFWVFGIGGNEHRCRILDCGKTPGQLADEYLTEAERDGQVLIRDRWLLTCEEFEPINRETVAEAVARQPGITTDECAALFGVSIIDANYWLITLWEAGELHRTGSETYRYYGYVQSALF